MEFLESGEQSFAFCKVYRHCKRKISVKDSEQKSIESDMNDFRADAGSAADFFTVTVIFGEYRLSF